MILFRPVSRPSTLHHNIARQPIDIALSHETLLLVDKHARYNNHRLGNLPSHFRAVHRYATHPHIGILDHVELSQEVSGLLRYQ